VGLTETKILWTGRQTGPAVTGLRNAEWLYGFVVVWLYGSMVLCMVVWLYGLVVVWLYGCIPSLPRQRFYQAGVLVVPQSFFEISQLFDAVDYSNYVFWFSETIIFKFTTFRTWK
jgi:hypothetical protein